VSVIVWQVLWDHHDPFYLFAGTDGGSLSCMDVRSSTPLFTTEAHTSALSALALSPSVSGCLVTASNDHSVKVWDVRGHSSPVLVRRRLCKIGEIHCAAACPDEPLLFCVGGDCEMKLVNFCNDETVTEKFYDSNTDLTETAAGSPDGRNSNISPDEPHIVKASRKTKISRSLSPENPNSTSKSSRSNSTDHKVSRKSKQKTAEPSPSGSKVKKTKHLKTKRLKDTEVQS